MVETQPMSNDNVERFDEATRRLRGALADMHTAIVETDRDAYLEARRGWRAADAEYRALGNRGLGGGGKGRRYRSWPTPA